MPRKRVARLAASARTAGGTSRRFLQSNARPYARAESCGARRRTKNPEPIGGTVDEFI